MFGTVTQFLPWIARAGVVAACLAAASAVVLVGGCPPPVVPPPGSGGAILALEVVAEGFTSPIELAQPNDGSERLFIADQLGVIWVIESGEVLTAPLLDLQAAVQTSAGAADERGLLGFALHPNFLTNGLLYVMYNAVPGLGAPAGSATVLRLSEFRVPSGTPNQADANSERVLLSFAKPQNNHNGGKIAFGPDGLLYIGVGDGGGAGDIGFGHTAGIGNAQDRMNFLGKILRIDVNSGTPYAVPITNPFAGQAGVLGEIYAYGFRNPWQFSFDVEPGRTPRLFVADVGQSLMEEVNLVEAGGNYGWNRREGTLCFDPNSPSRPPTTCADVGPDGSRLRAPVLTYQHTSLLGGPTGTAVVGGYVYRGSSVPTLRGAYVFGDYSGGLGATGGKIFIATETALAGWSFGEVQVAGTQDGRLAAFLLAFGKDAAGELYVLTRSGAGNGTGVVRRISGYEVLSD